MVLFYILLLDSEKTMASANVLFFMICIAMALSKIAAMEGIVETLSGQSYPHTGAVDTCVDESSSLDGSLLSAK